MKVALYARVSTDDKGQNPEMQLDQLRKFCQDAGWEITKEYVDQASASDFIKRTAWTQLMKDASLRKFNVLLVWKLDRACRSAIDGANILGTLRAYNIGFKSFMEQYIDTTTPFGEALYHISMTFAGLERDMIKVRVNAGLNYARAHGTKSGNAIGHPKKNIAFLTIAKALTDSRRANGLPNYFAAAKILTEQTKIKVSAGLIVNRLKKMSSEEGITVKEVLERAFANIPQETGRKQALPKVR